MLSAEEEFYITMVVVKRPVKVGQVPLDPAEWAQTVLNTLAAQGMEHQVYTVTKMPSLPVDRFPPHWLQQSPQRREPESGWHYGRSKDLVRWICLVLSILSFSVVTYLVYILLHSRG